MWWRDEFLANDRVAERNRQILASARTHAPAFGEELEPVGDRPARGAFRAGAHSLA